MFSPDFFRCDICGNLLWLIADSTEPVRCCGEEMRRLEPGESDGGGEKHVPCAEGHNGRIYVQVGTELHPSTYLHHIDWIAYYSDRGMLFKKILPGELPVADFRNYPGEPAEVYSYCSLHGLWKTEITA